MHGTVPQENAEQTILSLEKLFHSSSDFTQLKRLSGEIRAVFRYKKGSKCVQMRSTGFITFLTIAVAYTSSQAIQQEALAKIFKYAAAGPLKALTTNINKKTTAADQKTVLNNWIPKNFKAAGATVAKGDKLGNQTYVKQKAVAFIDYRFSLKKFMNYMYNNSIKEKYMTEAEANKMRTYFWKVDADTHNSYPDTIQAATKEAARITGKKDILDKFHAWSGSFQKANPKDYANLGWSL
ncbi:unnamed protein product [Caenorhabditis auriculariae]|uniref:Uncharacterized protein n=1 Tax=Caenorhabditis auriculariae TaxID=2777116 RepID=A0A8S1HWI0_9PELO|nr:unnamed protein product [Caenorhabditis auriculariae]